MLWGTASRCVSSARGVSRDTSVPQPGQTFARHHLANLRLQRPPNGSFDESAPVDHDSVVRRGEAPVEPNPLPTSLRAWKPRTAPVLSIRWTVEQNQSRRRVERQLRPRDARQEGTECIREPRPRRSRAGPSQCAVFGAEPPPPPVPTAARTAAPATSPSTPPPESLIARSAATRADFTERRRPTRLPAAPALRAACGQIFAHRLCGLNRSTQRPWRVPLMVSSSRASVEAGR